MGVCVGVCVCVWVCVWAWVCVWVWVCVCGCVCVGVWGMCVCGCVGVCVCVSVCVKTALCRTVRFCKGFTRHKVCTHLSILLLSGVYHKILHACSRNVPLRFTCLKNHALCNATCTPRKCRSVSCLMQFTFNTLHIQQSAVLAYSTCVRLAHTFSAAHFLFRLPVRTAMNNNVAVCWDVTPCSLSTFRMNLLPPSSGLLYPCLYIHTREAAPICYATCQSASHCPYIQGYRMIMSVCLCVSRYIILNQAAFFMIELRL
jgi:hypothetical protein